MLLQEDFVLNELNKCGKKFERVNRLHCSSQEIDLIVDVNCELFKAKKSDFITIALARTLSRDGTEDSGEFNPFVENSLADDFDYVMNGKIFAMKHVTGDRIEVQASFGGLLLRMQGKQSLLQGLQMDMTSTLFKLIFYFLIFDLDYLFSCGSPGRTTCTWRLNSQE